MLNGAADDALFVMLHNYTPSRCETSSNPTVLTAFVLASGAAGVLPQVSRRVRTGGGHREHPRAPPRKARHFED
jgi:hypothetical protein